MIAQLILGLALPQAAISSCPAAVAAVQGQNIDARQGGALYLFERCDRALVSKDPKTAQGLRTAAGEASAAAVVLLGYGGGGEAVTMPAGKRVKLKPWSLPVDASVANAVAQARSGKADALVTAAGSSDLAVGVFLLDVIKDIDSPVALKALMGKLDDKREISGGVPSHAQPQRQLRDYAVDQFAARFGLKLSFPLTPSRRYSDAQIAEARAAVAKAIPSPKL